MAKAPSTAKPKAKKPKAGEETKLQRGGGVFGLITDMQGFAPPPGGTYAIYRKMRGHPTVALARMAATAPVRTANLSYESDEGTPDERVDFIRGQIDQLWPMLAKEMLYALDYGFSSFEKVFESTTIDGQQRWVYRKLKSLRPEKTKILVDRDTGAFAGLKQGRIELGPEKAFLFTYDGEAGNPYGRSRHENIRETAWHPWMQTLTKLGQYTTKVSGVIPMIEYPEGESRDSTGAVKSNFELAQAVLAGLGTGKGVAMPNILAKHADDLARAGIDVSQLKAWHIDFLETKGQHGEGLTGMLEYYDKLMLRGWLVPERAATEGTHGTKAEAGEHRQLSLVAVDLLLDDMLRHVNWYLIDPLLSYNFGPEAVGTVRAATSGLTEAERGLYRRIIEKVLTNPTTMDVLLAFVDLEALLDQTGIPRNEDAPSLEDFSGARPAPTPGDGLSMVRATTELYRRLHARFTENI